MGFRKLFGSSEEKLPLAEAFAGVALSAAVADGVVTEEETRALATSLRRMDLYRGLGDAEMDALMDGLFARLRDVGEAALLRDAAASVPADLRATAFAVAVDVVMADRRLHEKEQCALDELQRAMEIPDDLARDIVRVLRIKNRV